MACRGTALLYLARPYRRKKVRNEIIRENYYKNTILVDIWAKQLVWYGHVQRMAEERLH
jgi:hypothetical protein